MDKQSILAFVVIFLILIAMPFYYQLIDYNQPEETPADTTRQVEKEQVPEPDPQQQKQP